MQDDHLAAVTQLVHAAFPHPPVRNIVRVAEGVSTYVYRLVRDQDVLYLRVLPEVDATFAPEVLVHHLLHDRHVRAPAVRYYTAKDPTLHLSVMVTTEIPGQPIGYGDHSPAIYPVLRAAGRDLARINAIAVEGFGWVRRDQGEVTRLQAEYPTCGGWLEQDVAFDLTALAQSNLFTAQTLHALPPAIDLCRAHFIDSRAYLAHGDFDVTHIYHQGGAYTGIIDFGEIRGTYALYDLGHFAVENLELLPYLLEGYVEVTPLPADYARRIQLSSLHIALRRLSRRLLRNAAPYPPDVAAVARILQALDAPP